MMHAAAGELYMALEAIDADSGTMNAIIDTPKGSHNKYKLDERRGLFVLRGVLPLGAIFPFDFGYIPSTRAEDGDPIDVLVLLDEPVFVGCLVPAKLIGVIEAEQTENGKTERNDRLIAVSTVSRVHEGIEKLSQLSPHLLEEIEHFFISYNQLKGKTFKPLGRYGPRQARRLLDEAMAHYRSEHGEAGDGEQQASHAAGKG